MIVEARGIACTRGGRTLFDNLSFAVAPGQVLAVHGTNGSGKSSLLRIIAGLLTPRSGEILIDGQNAGSNPSLVRHIAYLGHLDGIAAAETPQEAAGFRLALAGNANLSQAKRAFTVFGLHGFADTQGRYLSAGQRRRAALAASMATDTILWILDEPTTGLDAESITRFQARLDDHVARGGSAIIATHDMTLVADAKRLSLPLGADPASSSSRGPVTGSTLKKSAAAVQPDSGIKITAVIRAFNAIVARDLRLAARQGWQAVNVLLFFVLAIMLLAFGVGPDVELLGHLAPGAIWVAALLACLLSFDRLFIDDCESGAMDAVATSPVPLEAAALAKMTAHWLATGLPLALVAPAGALLLHLPLRAMPAMVGSLLLGTPVLSLIGGIAAALMVGARRGGVLIALLALPLYIPVLIFGAAAIETAVDPAGSTNGALAMIAALLALFMPVAPIAAAAALRD